MGKVEAAAEHVTELVVQGHTYAAEAHAAKPGTIECVGAGLSISRALEDFQERPRECRYAILRHYRYNRVAILRIQRLHGVRDRVHSRNCRLAAGKAQGKVNIVNYYLG